MKSAEKVRLKLLLNRNKRLSCLTYLIGRLTEGQILYEADNLKLNCFINRGNGTIVWPQYVSAIGVWHDYCVWFQNEMIAPMSQYIKANDLPEGDNKRTVETLIKNLIGPDLPIKKFRAEVPEIYQLTTFNVSGVYAFYEVLPLDKARANFSEITQREVRWPN